MIFHLIQSFSDLIIFSHDSFISRLILFAWCFSELFIYFLYLFYLFITFIYIFIYYLLLLIYAHRLFFMRHFIFIWFSIFLVLHIFHTYGWCIFKYYVLTYYIFSILILTLTAKLFYFSHIICIMLYFSYTTAVHSVKAQ